MASELIRLNKYLSDAGVCSRREADRLIEAGKIIVDGHVALLGERVTADQGIAVDGKQVKAEAEKLMIVFNKPQGIVCTSEKKEKYNIIDFIGYPIRIYPVGRLDKSSEGLILLTNQGEIVNKMMRSGNKHEKEYIVSVDKEITAEFLTGMAQGVPILETVTRKCILKKNSSYSFTIILTQGLNRQIRRMCEYFGYKVTALKRVRIMNIELGNLPIGEYRKITEEEWKQLNELIKDSSNEPVYTLE